MINLAYALVAGLFASVASYLALDAWWSAVLPGLVVFTGLFIVLWRRTNKQVEAHFANVQKEMMKGKPQNFDRAIVMMKEINAHFGKRQFFLESGINGQIGSILFMQKKYDEARPYLEKSFARAWEPQAMLAVLQYKKKDMNAVDETFERATKVAGNSGLLWSIWAWMHHKQKDNDRALAILNRAKEKLDDKDPQLTQNILQLQNDKKMKMKPYGQQWYVFMLEEPPRQKMAQRGAKFAQR